MARLIQLFSDNKFYKKLELLSSEISDSIIINETSPENYLSDSNNFKKQSIIFLNRKALDIIIQHINKIRENNFIVYVFAIDNDALNLKVEHFVDYFLPYDITLYNLSNIINLSKKIFDKNEQEKNGSMFSDHNLLQILMDNITDTIYFKDKDSKFVKVNKAQVKLCGMNSAEDVIGKTDFDFFNIEHSKEAYSVEQRIIFDGKPISKLEYVGTRDGNFRWMSSSKVPIFDDGGKVVGTVGITRNVDKMVRVEHRIKAERDLLQLLIDNIPSPIYFKDIQSKFTR
nr:PAS domain S-box protein [Prolixibacteraceae bacterium]